MRHRRESKGVVRTTGLNALLAQVSHQPKDEAAYLKVEKLDVDPCQGYLIDKVNQEKVREAPPPPRSSYIPFAPPPPLGFQLFRRVGRYLDFCRADSSKECDTQFCTARKVTHGHSEFEPRVELDREPPSNWRRPLVSVERRGEIDKSNREI